MKIGIANSNSYSVDAIKTIFLSNKNYKIIWVAENSNSVIQKCIEEKPDLILLDLFFADIDGARLTQKIMELNPTPILITTSKISDNTGKIFEAMGFGALDVISSPSIYLNGEIDGGDEFLKKIIMIEKLIGKNEKDSKLNKKNFESSQYSLPSIVAIGSSTGGPKALSVILSEIPKNIDAAIIIIQHIDEQFATSLVDWLKVQCSLPIILAKENSCLEANKVYIAGTNDHLILGHDLKFHYIIEPKDYPYRPSVDTFFFSLAKNVMQKNLAILLTGMGRDGANGLLELKRNGWYTIVQNQSTSVVFGMPKAAIELGAETEILPIEKISDSIKRFLNKKGIV